MVGLSRATMQCNITSYASKDLPLCFFPLCSLVVLFLVLIRFRMGGSSSGHLGQHSRRLLLWVCHVGVKCYICNLYVTTTHTLYLCTMRLKYLISHSILFFVLFFH